MTMFNCNTDFIPEERSDKIRDLENDGDWCDNTNNLLNTNLWTNTIPIEVLYPTNSPDLPNDENNGDILRHNNNISSDIAIDTNLLLNNNFRDSNKNQSAGININESTNSLLTFDEFINCNFDNGRPYNIETDNNFNNNKNNLGLNNDNDDSDDSNNNTFSNMFNDNSRNNFKNIDISEWLKEQNNKKLNNNNNILSPDELNFYNYNDNKLNNYNNNNKPSFNFLNSSSNYASSLSPTTPPIPPISTIPTDSSIYNSPLTCVLLSSSFYANSTPQQTASKPFITTSEPKETKLEKTRSREQSKATDTHLPGGLLDGSFDPSRRSFSADELKISQIVPKSQKKFVPSEKKDMTYWSRRQKNNKAAKRSREAKRLKENHITLRTAFLEEENSRLKTDVTKLITENKNLRVRLANYELYEAKFDVN